MSGQTKCPKCGLSYDQAVCPLCVPVITKSPTNPESVSVPKRRPARVEYIQKSKVKALVAKRGKRCGESFLLALDDLVRQKIVNACRVHNGGKKTLDASVLRVLK